jgi:hypothetical protein
MIPLPHLRPPWSRALLAATAAALALLTSGGTAAASPSQESIMQDDHVLYNEGAVVQARALDQMAALGVDTIHTLISWRGLAPDSTATRPPRGKRLDDPRSYPGDKWNPYDDLVRGALARGMQVLVTPTGPAPRWAEGCSASEREMYNPGTCRPSSAKFGQFVEAIARRYSGRYTDDTDRTKLPAVRRWSFWNEPNLNSWLSPQTQRVRGRTVLKGAAMYRSLVHAGAAGLRAACHRRDQVLLGESAPIAGGKRGTAPVTFYRALFCVDSRGRKLNGSTASAIGCRKPRRLPVNGIAHHPYTRGAGDPLTTKQSANQITIAYTSRLKAVARQGERSGLVPRGISSRIYFTEFGVSSSPPGTRFSVPLETQAEWINQGDYMAYRDSAVRSVAQFALEDDPSFGRETFQTGICFYNQPNQCYPKPAYDAYRVPIYVVDRGRSVQIYGQARPATASQRRIDVQNRADSNAPWQTVATVDLSARGHFLKSFPERPGSWRLVWTPVAGTSFVSREAVARSR